MTKIAKSLAMIALVAAIAVGATSSYFSDKETSTGNYITAGSLDLIVNGANGDLVSAVVIIKDMKPSQTWYSGPITLEVSNNPGKLYKHIVRDFVCNTVDVTEPECDAISGTWSGTNCTNGNDINDLTKVTWFDLAVWVGLSDAPSVAGEGKICDANITTNCWDTIIPDGTITVDEIASQWIYLGTYGERMQDNEITIRQSFHMWAEAGNEYQSDSCSFTEEFMVLQTNAPHPDPVYIPDNAVLDSVDVGDSNSTSMVDHNAQGWLDYVDGNYGGRDGGESIAMVWGDDNGNKVCDINGEDKASFTLDAGTETATNLSIRHYDGQSDDSFNVYVNGSLVGSYANQNSSESPSHWYTTSFSVSYTGNATIEIIATGPAGDLCVYNNNTHSEKYGQVALNWAKITN